MRIANVNHRACLITADGAVDVNVASQAQFPADIAELYERWAEFRAWAEAGASGPAVDYSASDLGSPSPRPRQVFGIATNYRDHSTEAGIEPPKKPAIFTKFPTCIAGPTTDIELPSDRGDWEVELVVVIGVQADRVSVDDAWGYAAGITVGQDISERRVQFQKPIMQLDLGKSFPTFGPMGPHLVTIDEVPDPDDLPISCLLNGEEVQSSRTSNLIFDVPTLISYISHHVTMLPGDAIFTGTPAGVGSTRDPRRYLQPGDELISRIDGVGEMHNRCIERPD